MGANYITFLSNFAGFGDDIVPLEKSCLLCDGDLANEPEYYLDMASLNPAENAVLSCGHVFHSMCLRQTITEEKCRDPPCIICASSLLNPCVLFHSHRKYNFFFLIVWHSFVVLLVVGKEKIKT